MGTDGLVDRWRGCRVFVPTAPAVLVRTGDHLGLNRILVDVSKQGDEIPRIANGLTAKTVVEQGTKTFMPLVEVTDVGDADAFHYCADILGTLGDEEVYVVIHQAIGVDMAKWWQWLAVAVLGSCDSAEYLEELAAVLIICKDVAAVNTAQHHVVNTGGALLSALAWHSRGRLVLQI